MKKILIIFSFVLLVIALGCTSEIKRQIITIQKQVVEENIFEDYREVRKREQVQQARDIVKKADWENAEVTMSRFPDYQFQFTFANDKNAKIASYLLWVSPNGENLEIVTDGGKYVKLAKLDSENLFEIITGQSLEK